VVAERRRGADAAARRPHLDARERLLQHRGQAGRGDEAERSAVVLEDEDRGAAAEVGVDHLCERPEDVVQRAAACEQLEHLLLARLAGLRPLALLEEGGTVEGGADDRPEHERLVHDVLAEAVPAVRVAEEEAAGQALASHERQRERGLEAEPGVDRGGGLRLAVELVLERRLAGACALEDRRLVERHAQVVGGHPVGADRRELAAPERHDGHGRHVEERRHLRGDDAGDALRLGLQVDGRRHRGDARARAGRVLELVERARVGDELRRLARDRLRDPARGLVEARRLPRRDEDGAALALGERHEAHRLLLELVEELAHVVGRRRARRVADAAGDHLLAEGHGACSRPTRLCPK
jgi:hypothetical protein